MPSYLIEVYQADYAAAFEDARERALRTAELGRGVSHVRTTFIPGDETILHIFEAPSGEELHRAARLATLAYQRIVEAVETSADEWAAGRGLYEQDVAY